MYARPCARREKYLRLAQEWLESKKILETVIPLLTLSGVEISVLHHLLCDGLLLVQLLLHPPILLQCGVEVALTTTTSGFLNKTRVTAIAAVHQRVLRHQVMQQQLLLNHLTQLGLPRPFFDNARPIFDNARPIFYNARPIFYNSCSGISCAFKPRALPWKRKSTS